MWEGGGELTEQEVEHLHTVTLQKRALRSSLFLKNLASCGVPRATNSSHTVVSIEIRLCPVSY